MRLSQSSSCIKNNTNPLKSSKLIGLLFGLMGLSLGLISPCGWALEAGITETSIRVGAHLPLEGDRKANGLALKQGIEAALANQSVRGLRLEYLTINDFYQPDKAVEAAKQLIEKGVFLILGSYGTPTVKAVLPLLAEKKVPVVAPYSGAAFSGPGDVLNLRASTANEVESVVNTALTAGLKPGEVCAYVQNDAFGMSGLSGLRSALAKHTGPQELLNKLDQILALSGEHPARNGMGPVGVYERDSTNAREGYNSLKKWETDAGSRCRLVVTTAVYDAAVNFIAYARFKDEKWIFSSTSTAAGNRLQTLLKEKNVTDRVLSTEVMPPLNAPLPIVAEARKALGPDLNPVSLEGYIDGKFLLAVLQATETPLTRENFLKAARRQSYDLGGVKIDFTTDNQGYDYVGFLLLKDAQFAPASAQEIAALFK